MARQENGIPREDYVEPRCLLGMDPMGEEENARPIPQRRVMEKLDEYMSRRDYDGAGRHLNYWLEEAKMVRDLRGELLVRNELIGHYRKTGNKAAALENAAAAESLVERLGMERTVSAGTTWVNAATACNAFGENERALALFEKARAVYEESAGTGPALLGGLYNNMALTYGALGRYDEALELYEKAFDAMGKLPDGVLEQGITCLNMADAYAGKLGMEQAEGRIFDLLDRALELLDTPSVPRDGYYAFVCEKCAPTFDYYGYFAAAEDLRERARTIYERA